MKYLGNKIAFALLVLLALGACTVEPNFDEPPTDVGVTTPAANTTIAQLKALLTNPNVPYTITDDLIIRGVVISDDRTGNFYKQLVIQDSTAGLEISTYGTYLYTQYPVGRTIAVRCKGLILISDNSLIKLVGDTYEDSGRTEAVGLTDAQLRTNVVKGPLSATPPTPRVVTISQIKSDPSLLSTLIKIENVQFTAADTSLNYAEVQPPSNVNRNLQDCNNNELILRNSGYSTFANVRLPSGKGSITGILGTYRTDRQLYIRSLDDVSFTDPRCGSGGNPGGGGVVTALDEQFTTATANQDIALAGWANLPTVGARTWRASSFSGNFYAQATAFGSGDAANEVWLITPAIDISAAKTFSFKSSWAYYVHQGLSVWYSTNFNGQDVSAATWTEMTDAYIAQQADLDSGNFGKWMPSGNISLPVQAGGKLYIGFKYVGDKATNTTTWRIDDVKVQ